MRFTQQLGIVSYGAYLPQFVIAAAAINQKTTPPALGVKQKTVADIDEDTTTLSVAAAQQALARLARKEPASQLGCLFIGSESHVYAVKPTGTIVAQALGLPSEIALADLQFACKAGTQALQIGFAYVQSGMATQALAIGADTAQSRPGDALEYTAAAGGAAFIVGKHTAQTPVLAKLIATNSVATDTPDFWRRPKQAYPEHGGRFTGEPAYFSHVAQATQNLLKTTKLKPADIHHCIFHTPNGKFPQKIAKKLGFTQRQLAAGLVVPEIGNTYAAASLLGLAAVFDQARKGQKILLTSYGSGAGADSFLFEVTAALASRRRKKSWGRLLREQIAQTDAVNYQQYRTMMELKE